MLVNAQSVKAIFVNLKTTFNKAFTETSSTWQKIAMRVTSTGSSNEYDWLENYPKMEEWIGSKVIKSLKAFSYSIKNKNFAVTVRVKRDNIEDDNLGLYVNQAEGAGWSAKQFPDELVYQAVNDSFNAKCYDGKPFISTQHPVGKALVSNKGTKKLSAATLAAAQASYGAARIAMKKFKDDRGRPLRVNPNILLVPPALEDTAKLLMTTERFEDGKPNPYRNTAEVVVEPLLESDDAWFLLDCTKPVKPYIFQDRKAAEFVQQTNPDAQGVFMDGDFLFGAEARANAGYGFWQMVWGSDGTVA